jgi:hypothetical protein
MKAYGYTRESQPCKSLDDSVNQALQYIEDPETPAKWNLDKALEMHSDNSVYRQLNKLYGLDF